jgi:hypothetical protein
LRRASASPLTPAINKNPKKKLVATSNFRNTAPDKINVADKVNDLHVHKGARFSIGGDLPLEKLTADEKKLAVELNCAGRIVEVSQVELVAKIDEEVKMAEAIAKKKLAAMAVVGDKK